MRVLHLPPVELSDDRRPLAYYVLRRSGETHESLADALGVTTAHVTRMLSGRRRPSESFKRVVARSLGGTWSVEELFDR